MDLIQTMTHKGIITRITPKELYVRIIDGAGCESCRLAGCCGTGSGEGATAEVRVVKTGGAEYRTGQTVTVATSPRMMERAVVWAFLLPLAILLICIFAFAGAADSTLGAAVGLVGVAAYFLVMRLVRRRLARHLRWKLDN